MTAATSGFGRSLTGGCVRRSLYSHEPSETPMAAFSIPAPARPSAQNAMRSTPIAFALRPASVAARVIAAVSEDAPSPTSRTRAGPGPGSRANSRSASSLFPLKSRFFTARERAPPNLRSSDPSERGTGLSEGNATARHGVLSLESSPWCSESLNAILSSSSR